VARRSAPTLAGQDSWNLRNLHAISGPGSLLPVSAHDPPTARRAGALGRRSARTRAAPGAQRSARRTPPR
jgi:hypothetical protein